MKTSALPILSALSAAVLLPVAAEEYTLHEWGTFTAVIGSDGTHLDGVEREDAPLPGFVYQLDSQRPDDARMTKGLQFDRTFAHVNVRLETPVLYFYTDRPFDAQVDVGFKGGAIGQWFPDRSAGEPRQAEELLDFAQPRVGSIRWNVRVEPAGEDQSARVFRGNELPCWLYPRLPDSALVTNAKNETEKYLFYRGLGRMDLPVVFTATDQELHAVNAGKETIPQWLVFERDYGQGARWWVPGPLAPSANQGQDKVTVGLQSKPFVADWKDALYADGLKMLMDAGLYRKEADAMLQTWWGGYFETSGLRVFWIVPRNRVDEVLPLQATPQPASIERVLVGRSEILTPGFEKRLVADFAEDREKGNDNRWANDRFFPAYSARVRQLTEAPAEAAVLPVGKWNVRFENGVAATCEIREDGSATVAETARAASGKAVVKGTFVEIRYDDDRAERWALEGEKMTVRHWFPAAAMPDGPPVSGVAERLDEAAAKRDEAEPQAALTVHEWGTFTVLEGSDGMAIDWYQSPAKLVDLPAFVRRSWHFGGKSGTAQLFASSGRRRMDSLRMETPVLYFYPEKEMDVSVSATFPGGRITEVFPPASTVSAEGTVWNGRLLPPDSPERAKVPAVTGKQGRHYGAAREVPEAWLFRSLDGVPSSDAEAIREGMLRVVSGTSAPTAAEKTAPIDHFIFYRGAGNGDNFGIRAVQGEHADTFTVTNTGAHPIPRLFALRVRGGKTSWLALDQLLPVEYVEGKPQNPRTFTFSTPSGSAMEVAAELRGSMIGSLTAEGLTGEEAAAMVATWDDLWFTEAGTRLLAVLPPEIPDELVPLQIAPAPAKLDRVFVARVEIISREQEQALVSLLNVSAGSDADGAARGQLENLNLGRFAEGGLIRAATLVSRAMQDRFLSLSEHVE